MSKIAGDLFGNPSKSDSAQQSNSQSGYGALPGFAQNAFQQGVTGIQNLATTNPSLFAPAGFNSTQQQAFNLANQGPTQLNASTVGGLTSDYMNPYTSSVVDTTNQQIEKANAGLLSQIGGDASNAGAFGGTRMGAAQALQNNNTQNTIAATDAGLNAQGYNNAQTNAINSINTNNTNQQQTLANLLGIGGQQQNQATAQQQAPLTALQAMLSAAQGLPATSNSSASGTSSATGASTGIFGSGPSAVSGAGSSLASLAAFL